MADRDRPDHEDRKSHLEHVIGEISEEYAVRAVILHNTNQISDAFRLKVLRREIRRIEERMSDEGPSCDARVRRQLKLSEDLKRRVAEWDEDESTPAR